MTSTAVSWDGLIPAETSDLVVSERLATVPTEAYMRVDRWFQKHVVKRGPSSEQGRAILTGDQRNPLWWVCRHEGRYALCFDPGERVNDYSLGGIVATFDGGDNISKIMDRLLEAATAWRDHRRANQQGGATMRDPQRIEDEIEKVKRRQKQHQGERYQHPDKGQPELHILQDDDGTWQVWLNTGIADFDGLVIGVGPTRQAAVADAVGVVEWSERTLQETPHFINGLPARRIPVDVKCPEGHVWGGYLDGEAPRRGDPCDCGATTWA